MGKKQSGRDTKRPTRSRKEARNVAKKAAVRIKKKSESKSQNAKGKFLPKAVKLQMELEGKKAPAAATVKRDRAESKASSEAKRQRTQQAASAADAPQAKKSGKKFGEVVEEAKKVWEEARKTELSAEERAPLLAKLFDLLGKKLQAVVLRHEASRVVQTMLKYGTAEQREQIAEALTPITCELALSHYGKYLLMKLLRYGVKDVRVQVIRHMQKKMAKLLTNKESAHVLEYIFSELTGKRRLAFMKELYGPAFAVFYNPQLAAGAAASSDQDELSLVELIRGSTDKSLQRMTVQHLELLMSRMLHKGPPIIEFSILHKLMRDYFTLIDDRRRRDFAGELREMAVHILHTTDGSWLAAQAVRYATPKDRKVLVRQLKGYVGRAASEEHGHVVIMACLTFVDDTVLLAKNVVKALVDPTSSMALPSSDDPEDVASSRPKQPLLHYILDRYARLCLLQIMAPGSASYFSPTERELMQPCYIREKEGSDTENEESSLVPTSRKAPDVRKAELLAPLKAPLLSTLTEHAVTVACSDTGFAVLYEALLAFAEPAADTQAILDQLVDNVAALAVDPVGHRTVRWLLERAKDYPHRARLANAIAAKLRTAADDGDSAASLAELAQHQFASWVLVSLLGAADAAVASQLAADLRTAAERQRWPPAPGTNEIVKLIADTKAKTPNRKKSSGDGDAKKAASTSTTPKKAAAAVSTSTTPKKTASTSTTPKKRRS